VKRQQLIGTYLFGLAVLVMAGVEILEVATGSGHFLGRLSSKWSLALGLYILFIIALSRLAYLNITNPERLETLWEGVHKLRLGVGRWRLLAAAILALFPSYFVFFSDWGTLFPGLFTRLALFLGCTVFMAAILTSKEGKALHWKPVLLSALIIGALLTVSEALTMVSDYPFALHWSEGNRLWDYSVLFGRGRYNYPVDQELSAFIDQGRQSLWGLPFLIPGVPIWAVRLWGAFLVTVPYALLGWLAFRPPEGTRRIWILAGLWSLIFLNQGPIYTPLVLSAILVALAWRKPLWIALPLVFMAGHYAGLSRFTWRFAPALWMVMLFLGDVVLRNERLRWRDGLSAAALFAAGIWTKGLPVLTGIAAGLLAALAPAAQEVPGATPTPAAGTTVETLAGLQAATTDQPFIWSRLLPNEVFAPGILLGVILATLPLILLLIHLHRKGLWKTVFWQRVVTIAIMLAFLAVGLVASAKVGGGADLHNLDMFLVALVLLAGLAWEGRFPHELGALLRNSPYVRVLLAAAVFIPAFWPMAAGHSLRLPSEARTQAVLQQIQDKVSCAAQYGEVLFMDQRQLLTFGYVENIPLVPEYEKKLVMNEALANDEAYFNQFYADLASGRFSLIVTERQAILYKEANEDRIGDSLVEENNAWVNWVTEPLLRYYESVDDHKDVSVELFMPRDRDFVCP
jgi:hypothetical protein